MNGWSRSELQTSLFSKLFDLSGVKEIVQPHKFTLLIPINQVFVQNFEEDMRSSIVQESGNTKVFEKLVLYHLLEGDYSIEDIQNLPSNSTISTFSANTTIQPFFQDFQHVMFIGENGNNASVIAYSSVFCEQQIFFLDNILQPLFNDQPLSKEKGGYQFSDELYQGVLESSSESALYDGTTFQDTQSWEPQDLNILQSLMSYINKLTGQNSAIQDFDPENQKQQQIQFNQNNEEQVISRNNGRRSVEQEQMSSEEMSLSELVQNNSSSNNIDEGIIYNNYDSAYHESSASPYVNPLDLVKSPNFDRFIKEKQNLSPSPPVAPKEEIAQWSVDSLVDQLFSVGISLGSPVIGGGIQDYINEQYLPPQNIPIPEELLYVLNIPQSELDIFQGEVQTRSSMSGGVLQIPPSEVLPLSPPIIENKVQTSAISPAQPRFRTPPPILSPPLPSSPPPVQSSPPPVLSLQPPPPVSPLPMPPLQPSPPKRLYPPPASPPPLPPPPATYFPPLSIITQPPALVMNPPPNFSPPIISVPPPVTSLPQGSVSPPIPTQTNQQFAFDYIQHLVSVASQGRPPSDDTFEKQSQFSPILGQSPQPSSIDPLWPSYPGIFGSGGDAPPPSAAQIAGGGVIDSGQTRQDVPPSVSVLASLSLYPPNRQEGVTPTLQGENQLPVAQTSQITSQQSFQSHQTSDTSRQISTTDSNSNCRAVSALDIIKETVQLRSFHLAIVYSSMEYLFNNQSQPVTIFAPNNEAFKELGHKQSMLTHITQDVQSMQAVLRYHAVPAQKINYQQLQFVDKKKLPTFGQNADIDLILWKDIVLLRGMGNTAAFLEMDVGNACNVALHIIDSVLLPFQLD